VRTSRMQVATNHQHESDRLDSDACQDERDARRPGREQRHGGENKPPTGEQKEKTEQLHQRAPGARDGPRAPFCTDKISFLLS